MKSDNEILDLSFSFSVELLRILSTLSKTTANQIAVRQCMRSGTSIGANAEEAVGASSRKEFIRCLTIARREARETRYWLRLLVALNPSNKEELHKLGGRVTSLLKLLNSIIATSKKTS